MAVRGRSRDWSLGRRLGLGFGLTLLVLVVLAGAVAAWSAQSARAQDALETRITPRRQAAQALELKLLYVALAARSWTLEPTAASAQLYQRRVVEAKAALHTLKDLPREPDGEVIFREVELRLEDFLEAHETLVGGGATALRAEELQAVPEGVTDALTRFQRLQAAKQEAALGKLDAARRSATWGTSLAVALALGLFAAVAYVTWRSIRVPTKRLLEVAASLELGDWQPALAWVSARPQRARHDEMMLLAQAFGAAAFALEKREQRLRADQRIATVSGSSLSRETLCVAVLETVCEYAKTGAGALYSVEPGKLLLIAGRGAAVGEALAVRVVEEKRPLVEGDPPMAAVPLLAHDEVVGVLMVGAPRERDPELVSFLEVCALKLGMGLQNVKAYEQITALVTELGRKSEQIQTQNEELQAQNEELHSQGEEIQAQNQQLKRSEEQLREVDQRRAEFLAFLAHELRNPLAAITSSLHLLGNARSDGAVRDRAEQVIARQTRQLTRLVDDLLDVTRISSGKLRLRLEPVDLVAVVREVVEDSRGRAEQAGVSLQLEVPARPVMVKGDRSRLTQVLGNLLDNALKFGGTSAPVQVRLSVGPGQPAELTVEDGGVGIEPGLLPRLFRPFSQADTSLEQRKAGLGLGLSLVKSVIELHGGTVEAHSEGVGRGSRFTLRLPVTEAAPRAPTARRVLIIEDNAETALAMKESMELRGHEARTASTGARGLEEARTFAPEVVLCDLSLPGMDGYEVARQLRADARFSRAVLVALSGYAERDDRERSAKAGFDRHLAKPPDVEALESIIDHLPLPSGGEGRGEG